tara:strand:- start:2307 stop:2459 length:153 start_codon:yes stop_codon:yes gene_type:complete
MGATSVCVFVEVFAVMVEEIEASAMFGEPADDFVVGNSDFDFRILDLGVV